MSPLNEAIRRLPVPIYLDMVGRPFPVTTPSAELFDPYALLADAEFMRAFVGARIDDVVDSTGKVSLLALLDDLRLKMTYAQARWQREGKVVYRLSPGLAQEFADTDIRVVGSDLISPVPAFHISFSGMTVHIEDANDELQLTEIVGVDVCEVDRRQGALVPGEIPPERLLANIPADQQQTWQYELPVALRVENSTENTVTVTEVLQCGSERQWLFVVYGLPAGGAPGELTIHCVKIPRNFTDPAVLENSLRFDAMAVPVRVAITMMLYLQEPNADRTPTTIGHERMIRDLAKSSGRKPELYRVSDIGKNTAVHDYYKADAATRTLQARHMVRAHYRRLASGRLTRVKAHWKGPPWAEVIARVQNLKDA